MQLSEIIIQRIRTEGPLSFHDFMEMCLYYPCAGYYTSGKSKIGKNGDYYTTPNISKLFGALIGKQLEQMWNLMGRKEFSVVEYGAGTGMLCHDILEYLKNNANFYSHFNYHIIEKSPVMRETEKTHLHEKVSWYDSIRDIPGFTGCVLSNEVVDNFAVHQVVMKKTLMEVFVDYRNGFVETLRPAKKELANYLHELNVVLPEGFRTELNLDAIGWIKEIATTLNRGYVITIDYGYPSAELYCNCRRSGTLLTYHKHTVCDKPYLNIGEQDITSHVNFSALVYWGEKFGLNTNSLTSQADFLRSLGLETHLSEIFLTGKDYLQCKQYAFLKYLLLFDMGQKFKVLVQNKGAPPIPRAD